MTKLHLMLKPLFYKKKRRQFKTLCFDVKIFIIFKIYIKLK